jgi:fatty acyl-ACP thioesterase B
MPTPAVEGYDLTDLILEYRRECGHSDVVESMTSPVVISHDFETGVSETSVTFSPLNFGVTPGLPNFTTNVHYTHLLRMQTDRAELVRGKTIWRLKEQA